MSRSTSSATRAATASGTDIATDWTVNRSVRTRAAIFVTEAIEHARRALPFPILGIDSHKPRPKLGRRPSPGGSRTRRPTPYLSRGLAPSAARLASGIETDGRGCPENTDRKGLTHEAHRGDDAAVERDHEGPEGRRAQQSPAVLIEAAPSSAWPTPRFGLPKFLSPVPVDLGSREADKPGRSSHSAGYASAERNRTSWVSGLFRSN